MATYLRGVTDYIPEVQPFAPDLNLYSKVLGFKQSKFDAASKQLSTLYTSLMNAPLTREDNIEARDNFFKVIDQDIKKMSTLDLSLQQNLDAAKDVFNGLLDNKNLTKDLVWTKNWMSEMQKGQSLRNCTDPKKCGGSWWEGGDQYMNLKRMEFKNANPDQAYNMGSTKYVAAQNITEKAMAIAKDLDIEIEADPIRQGGFIITGSDDPKEAQVFNNLLMGAIGKDPLVQDYYRAQQYNKRMNWSMNNEQQYGSLDAATAAYVNQNFNIISGLENKEYQAEDDLNNTKEKQKQLQKVASNTIPANRRSMVDINNELQKETQAYTETVNVLKDVNGNARVAINNVNNPIISSASMDKVLGNMQLSQEISGVAQNLALSKVSRDVKVDQYALENTKFKNRLFLEDVKSQNRFKVEKFKFDLEQAAEQIKAQGTSNMNTGTPVDVAGANAVGDLESASYENRTRGFAAVDKTINKAVSGLSQSEAALIDEVLYKTKNEGRLGNIQAKEDYVNMVYAYSNAYNEAPELRNQSGGENEDGDLDPITANTKDENFQGNLRKVISQMQSANTLQERYKIASEANLDLGKLAGPALDHMYDSYYSKMLNPASKKAPLRKSYLNEVWENSFNLKDNIKAKDLYLSQMQNQYKKQSSEVVDAAYSSPAYSELGPIFNSFINKETGYIRNRNEFVNSLVKSTNYSTEDAKNMYDGKYDFDDISGGEYDDYTLRDLWKVAFTDLANPNGNGLAPGMGDKFTRGSKYSLVDPDAYSSNAVQASVSYLRNALNSQGAIYDLEDFQLNIPESNTDAKNMSRQLLNGIINMKGKDYRPIYDVTYSNIAGGSDEFAAMNIKVVNEEFFTKFKGSKDDRGAIYENREQLLEKGITVYLPKSEANNIFTQRATASALDDIMNYNNKIEFNQYDPNYVKNLILARQNNGTYMLTGDLRVGLNENGVPEFDAIRQTYQPGGPGTLNNISEDIHEIIQRQLQISLAQDQQYLLNNN